MITNIIFHIIYIGIVYGNSNGPQNDDGNYLGPCSTACPVAAGKLCHLAIGVPTKVCHRYGGLWLGRNEGMDPYSSPYNPL